MKTIDNEMKFLADAHTKAVVKGVSDAEFLERCKALYLSADISGKAFEAAKVLYGEGDSSLADLMNRFAANRTPKPKAPKQGYSSGCGSSSSSSSGCGSSSGSSSSPC